MGLKPQLTVERDRGSIIGKHLQSNLLIASGCAPVLSNFEQRGGNSSPPMVWQNVQHQYISMVIALLLVNRIS